MKTALSRRRFLQTTSVVVVAGAGPGLISPVSAAEPAAPLGDLSILPQGATPAPVAIPHFPDRLHAFVWRNWSLVGLDRLARTLGARPAEVRALGRALGLGRPPRISSEQRRRGYITVIKRNWHLLPYVQLLELLGWSAAELAYTLREDDFLWIKLGSLKPKCAPLRWPEGALATQALLDGAARVRAVVRSEFGGDLPVPSEPLFAFVRELSRGGVAAPAASVPASGSRPGAPRPLRFCYSYFALYGDPLLEADLGSYPDGYLARLAARGVTGVWLQAVLYRLAPNPWQAELSERYEERRQNLARLVARAARHGIQVFLYLNEPRAQPLAFFREHPEIRGVTVGDHATVCTSVPAVRRYLAESVAGICRAVPGLGGFFTITASENLTNCWSHGAGAGCSRCSARTPAEVIAEVNATLQQGIDDAGQGQQLLAWDWGWADAWAPEVIARLPAKVALMSVSEWSLPLERGGVKATVGEYSISAIGPGPRATRHWQLAQQRGLKTVAKIQANNTWELSALPYLPVLANVAEHITRLRDRNLDGIMLGWTLGGYPSPNLETVARVMEGGTLADVARARFGNALAPAVLAAWEASSAAFREFPYDGGVVYSAPLQTGPANLLYPERTGFQASMVGFPYDHLDAWRGPYPVDVFIAQLEKVAGGFIAAAETLERFLEDRREGTRAERTAAAQEVDLGRAAGFHFQSVANQSRFVRDRERLRAAPDSALREPLRAELIRVVRDELRLAKAMYELQSRDSRLGFEASNHYFYVPADLAEKVLNCRSLLQAGFL